MKTKKIFLITSKEARGSNYGIGTYFDLHINCLNQSGILFDVIYLHTVGDEINIINRETHKEYHIPFKGETTDDIKKKYYKKIGFILKELISEDYFPVFHLNFYFDVNLVNSLKLNFNCKVILTAHYTSWSFVLNGDYKRFLNIISMNEKLISDELEKRVFYEYQIEKEVLSACDHIICVANHTRNLFKDIYGIEKNKISLINNALSDDYKPLAQEEKEKFRQKYHLPDDKKIILFAGRLDEIKGLYPLIHGIKELFKEKLNIQPIFIGEGHFSKWLSELSGIWSKVIFTGRIGKKDLYEFYQLADVGVVPSYHEEFGLVALEMMMHKLPVVVTDTTGLSEIIDDGSSGLKVPVSNKENKIYIDPSVLADKISMLINSEDLRFEIGNNARSVFLEKYTLPVFQKKINSVYTSVAEVI